MNELDGICPNQFLHGKVERIIGHLEIIFHYMLSIALSNEVFFKVLIE